MTVPQWNKGQRVTLIEDGEIKAGTLLENTRGPYSYVFVSLDAVGISLPGFVFGTLALPQELTCIGETR